MNCYRRFLVFSALAALLSPIAFGAIPGAEKLLPDDTLVVVTAPDFLKLTEAIKSSPQSQLWSDPSLKAFKEKFLNKWDEDVLKPLEKELGIKFADYTSLPQGQLTFAITQDGWKGKDENDPGALLLIDTRDKADQLKKNLSDLRKKWVNAGKTLRTEKIRDVEFVAVTVSSNDVPKTLRNLVPKSSESADPGDEKSEKKTAHNDELFIGQADSLLIAGTSLQTVEKVVVRLRGGSAPVLADVASYQANQLNLFRESPFYGWINVKRFLDILLPVLSEKKENSDSSSPLDIPPQKVLNALGLSALKTIAFGFQHSNDGNIFQVFFSVPEADRQGLFKILAGEPKETLPPAFIPADVIKLQRWRVDGQKAWATLEKSLSDISPQAIGTLNFLLDSANNYAKEKDPGFDVRKNIIGNLGNDFISYQKSPKAPTLEELASPPSLFLIGSPNPEQLAGALKNILVLVSQRTGTNPEDREFLGRKIYSVQITIPGRPSGPGKSPTLSYAATSGYIAFSTDAGMIEEYLRTCDSPPKGLRDMAGLADATQKVTGPGSSLFGYQNDAETVRLTLELLKTAFGPSKGGAGSPLGALTASLGGDEKMKEWVDFSLLPPYEKISKYFGFSVYSGTATVDGLSFKIFTPVPNSLKK